MTIFSHAFIYFLFFVASASAAQALAAETAYSGYAKKYQLIERPWEIRYILLVEDMGMMKAGAILARKEMQDHVEAEPGTYRSYAALFDPLRSVTLSRLSKMGLQLVAYDRKGNVTSPHHGAAQLIGKRTDLDRIVLFESGLLDAPPYGLAFWFQGLSENDSNFAPAVCAMSDFKRYRKRWHTDFLQGNFGCREWTAQLHNEGRPYIDVTSYEKGGAFIKEFIGWADFRDAPKPVIGKHEKTWWCLHECPEGEAPGVIPDIAAWTRRHGFPLPKRPRKQPEFPDADFIGHWDD